MNMKKFIKFTVILALFAVYLTYYFVLQPHYSSYPGLENGRIFITDANYYSYDDLYLAGDWEFYYMELLDSKGFSEKSEKKYYTLPDYWQRDWNAALIGNNGFGSYRLQIDFENKKDVVTLHIPWVHGAYEVFANGKSVLKCGTVGTAAGDESADVRSKSTVIPLDSDKLELIIHISGYLGGKSGLLLPISLGSYPSVSREIATKNILDTIILAGLLITGLYHFILFILKKNDKGMLFFALFCLAAAVSHGTISAGILYRALPADNGFLAYDLYILSKSWLITFFAMYSYFLFGKKNGTGRSIIFILAALNSLSTVSEILWQYNFSLALYILTYSCFALGIVYILKVVYHMNRNRDRFSFLYTCGVVLSFISYSSDLLADAGIINSAEFGSTSLFIFVLFEAVILAKIFVDYSYENEQLLGHMESLVDERTAELAQANEQLLLSEQSKNELLASISHDLRTPITAIRGYMELLLSQPENTADTLEYIESAHARTQHMEKLIKDLFLLTQLTENRLQINKTSVHITDLMNEGFKVYKPIVRTKGIELVLENELENERVSADRSYLIRMLDNLIQNAIYYAKTKVIFRSKKDGDSIMLSIVNDGYGIEKEELPRVFDRFYKKREDGAGLGLFVVKELALAMDAKVCADSVLNEYTVFSIIFKLKQGD